MKEITATTTQPKSSNKQCEGTLEISWKACVDPLCTAGVQGPGPGLPLILASFEVSS